MKFFSVIISIGCCLVAVTQAFGPEQKLAFEKQMFDMCKSKENATDADVKVMLDRELPTTMSAKCLLACVQETIGVLKNGKPSMDGAVAVTKIAYADNSKALDITKTVMEDCGDISETNRCEVATKFMKCCQDSAIKHGVDPKKFM